jgi:hypothetical protein
VVFRSFCISNEICSGLKISIKDKFQNMMTGEVPVTMNILNTTKTTTNTKYEIIFSDRENFAFEIKRVSTGTKM